MVHSICLTPAWMHSLTIHPLEIACYKDASLYFAVSALDAQLEKNCAKLHQPSYALHLFLPPLHRQSVDLN